MFPEEGKIWSNGQLIHWSDAKIHVMTHGLHYGSGIFEGIRSYKTEQGAMVFRLDAHLERFFNSGKLYMYQLPFSLTEIKEGILHNT